MAPASQKTPAKDSQNASKMKQKSLVSFFGKAPAASASTSNSSQAKPAKASAAAPKPKQVANASKTQIERGSDDTSSDPLFPEARTPRSKNASLSSVVADANFTRSSDGASSVVQTPPTSDPVDVDMLSAEEAESKAMSSKPTVRSIYAPA